MHINREPNDSEGDKSYRQVEELGVKVHQSVEEDLRGVRPQGLKLPQLLLTLRHGVEQRRLYLEFKSLKGKYIYEIVTSLILIMNHHEAGNITKYFCITKNYYKS